LKLTCQPLERIGHTRYAPRGPARDSPHRQTPSAAPAPTTAVTARPSGSRRLDDGVPLGGVTSRTWPGHCSPRAASTAGPDDDGGADGGVAATVVGGTFGAAGAGRLRGTALDRAFGAGPATLARPGALGPAA